MKTKHHTSRPRQPWRGDLLLESASTKQSSRPKQAATTSRQPSRTGNRKVRSEERPSERDRPIGIQVGTPPTQVGTLNSVGNWRLTQSAETFTMCTCACTPRILHIPHKRYVMHHTKCRNHKFVQPCHAKGAMNFTSCHESADPRTVGVALSLDPLG